jgi:hypothetical protein
MSDVVSNGSEDTDSNDIMQAAKLQYGGDKVHHMGRRMSGMPLLYRMEKCYVHLDTQQLQNLNVILDKFPSPPQGLQTGGPTGQAGSAAQNKGSAGSWGSIRGLAEKFNMFSKS